MLIYVFVHSRFVKKSLIWSWKINPCFFRGLAQILRCFSIPNAAFLDVQRSISSNKNSTCTLTFLQKNCILMLKLHAFDRAILIEWDTDWGVSTYVIPLSPWTCASRPCRLAEVGLLCFFYLARSPRQVCTWQTYRVRTYSTGQFECSSSFLQLNSYFLKTDWLLLKLLWIRGKEEWVTYVTKKIDKCMTCTIICSY
jgi:hypothetical protein